MDKKAAELIKQTRKIMHKAPYRAFFDLWRSFHENDPFFNHCEDLILKDAKSHQESRARIINELHAAQTIALVQDVPGNPITYLAALDKYLHETFGGQGVAPPTIEKYKNKSYFIYHKHRPTLAFRHQTQTGHIRSWLEHHWIFPANIKGYEIIIRRIRHTHMPAKNLIFTKNYESLLTISETASNHNG